MKNRVFQILMVTMAAFMAVSCVSSPPAGHAAVNTFSHLQPLAVSVADIRIEDKYQPPMQAPYIEHTLVNPPYTSAYNMLGRAFQAAGSNDTLVLEIEQASIAGGQAPAGHKDSTAWNFWQAPEDILYRGDMKIRISLVRSVPPFDRIGEGEVNVNRSLTIPGNMSIINREMALNAMVEKMMADLHKGVVDILDNKFNVLAAP